MVVAATCTPGKDSIEDNNGHQYTIDSTGNAMEDGIAMVGGSDTAIMEFINGSVYGQSFSGLWYSWNQVEWTASDNPNNTLVASADAAAKSSTATPESNRQGPTSAPTQPLPQFLPPFTQPTPQPSTKPLNQVGSWSQTIQLPIIPVAAAVLPNGQIAAWSSNDGLNFEGDIGTAPSKTQFTLFKPGDTGPLMDAGVQADMFCPGISYLPDGRILVDGGSSSSHTSIYDPATNKWSDASPLNIARGYNGAVTLSNGNVFTIGGSWSGSVGPKDGELWSPNTGWKLTGISGNTVLAKDDVIDNAQGWVQFGDNHPWLFAMPGGRVFQAGPSTQMNFFNPATGEVTPAGVRGDMPYSINGTAVMYAPGKILVAGGSQTYTDGYAPVTGTHPATNQAVVIDITKDYTDPTAMPVVTDVSPLNHARAFVNGVVLPDGEVFIGGGQSDPYEFHDTNAVLTPELWNPVTMKFTDVADMPVPRDYHSTSLLLPDGRVYIGGGGDCGGCPDDVGDEDPNANHPDYNIYTPPYLYAPDGSLAVRPTITNAPSALTLGNTLTVSTSGNVASYDLVRMGSATHSLDTDQRRIPLTVNSSSNGTAVLNVPSDPGITVPGYYMLFALDANNVPSIASIIQVQSPAANQNSLAAMAESTGMTANDFSTANYLASIDQNFGATSPDDNTPTMGAWDNVLATQNQMPLFGSPNS